MLMEATRTHLQIVLGSLEEEFFDARSKDVKLGMLPKIFTILTNIVREHTQLKVISN